MKTPVDDMKSPDQGPGLFFGLAPSNNKRFRTLAVATIVAERVESLGMEFPGPTVRL
jgi:hypothetical protein